jgi:hypothetical protein
MPVTTQLLCRACNKDVTNAKRAKSPQGFFYCEACYLTAKQKAAAKTPAAPPPLAARQELPDTCPNCNTPVIGNRKLCIKCHRDVTKMDHIVARRAARSQIDPEAKIGHALGKTIKYAIYLLLLAIAVFISYGTWMMFHPPGPFDDYPTTRADAVRQLLNNIALGTDDGYEKAFRLISRRIRMTNNPRESDRYKMVYTQMHDTFLSKYGPDWPATATIQNLDPGSTDEIVPFLITLNHDEYHIQSQAQVSIAGAIENAMSHDDYPENGKRHFGIRDIEEYSLLPKPKIDPNLQQMIQQMKAMRNNH